MIRNMLQLAEILAILYCMAALYGQKMRYDIYAVILIIADIFLFTGINEYDFPVYLMSLSYVLVFMYGMLHYRMNVKVTVINCFLSLAITSVLQLIIYMPIFYLFVSRNGAKDIYDLILNIVCLFIMVVFGRKLRLKEISDFFIKRNKLLMGILIFALVNLGAKIYQMSKNGSISNEDYIQTVYFLVLFFFTVSEWQKSRVEAEKEKLKLEMNKLYYSAYEDLLTLVRERQHDLKNHINAILGMIYTVDNYEELIRKQTQYCECIMKKNEMTSILLSADNPLIVGFLYTKIIEAEEQGIEVKYKVSIDRKEVDVLEYEMVEVLGILIDNAIEALVGDRVFIKKMKIEIANKENKLYIAVSNSSDIYDISVVEKYFEQDASSKGKGHGIGLYKLKRLVKSKSGNIIITNQEIDNINFLKFNVII